MSLGRKTFSTVHYSREGQSELSPSGVSSLTRGYSRNNLDCRPVH